MKRIGQILFIICISSLLCMGCGKVTESENISISEKSESVFEPDVESNSNTENNHLFFADDGKLNYEYFKVIAPWMTDPEQIPTKEQAKQGTLVANKTDWEPTDIIEANIDIEEEISPCITNTTPLDIMISEIDDPFLYTAFSWGITSGCPTIRRHPTLNEMLTRIPEGNNDIAYRIPINFLRKTEEGSYYTVCKLKDGGYIYYIFYNDSVDTDNVYLWGGIYSEKKVSYSDFSDLKIGDGIEKVIDIDPSAKMCLATYIYNKKMIEATIFAPEKQVMLLTDGILEITYELRDMTEITAPQGYSYVPCDSDDLVVASIKYYPDFLYPSTRAMEKGLTDTETFLPIHILPQDYPPAS